MKKIIILLLTFISCNSSQEERKANYSSKMNIIGDWELCKIINDNKSIFFNVCTKLTFKENHKGESISPDNLKLLFNWDIKEQVIEFTFEKENDTKLFFTQSGHLNLKEFKDGEFQYLEMTDSNNNTTYILSR